ncbi:hypothetical protein PIROE2DRAFT_4199, partial [Piromyces sp. E2]
IFASDKTTIEVTNSTIKNINTDIAKYNEDSNSYVIERKYQNEEFYIGRNKLDNANLILNNVTFDNIYGGFKLSYQSKLIISNSTISNSFFKNGVFNINEDSEAPIGNNEITSSIFYHNSGDNGVIVNFNGTGYFSGSYKFKSCTFENNQAKDFGGIVYSINEHAHDIVQFRNCDFINNSAKY